MIEITKKIKEKVIQYIIENYAKQENISLEKSKKIYNESLLPDVLEDNNVAQLLICHTFIDYMIDYYLRNTITY
ncbi:MAG: hypothetical protein ACOCP8_05850 [archaeon]